MWHLALFLGQFLLKGKPKVKEFYIYSDSNESRIFSNKLKEIVEDPKWVVDRLYKVDIPGKICYVVVCKERYF